jgi:hypothetical protein
MGDMTSNLYYWHTTFAGDGILFGRGKNEGDFDGRIDFYGGGSSCLKTTGLLNKRPYLIGEL